MAFPYTLLVNSCDSFEDCWAPFFTLLRKYWPEPRPRVLLNTEKKDWRFGGIDLETTRLQEGGDRRLSWGECLDGALARISTPLVLYIQEDYFIEQPVDVALIDRMAAHMMAHPEIDHIGLTHFGAAGPFKPTEDAELWDVARHSTYRMSLQAGLWRVDSLRSYVLPWESGWMFELFGTVRSWKRKDKFLTLARDMDHPAITYQHTGIVKGQWSSFVPQLFEREGIKVDYSRRGFYDTSGSELVRKLRLVQMIAANPWTATKSLLAN